MTSRPQRISNCDEISLLELWQILARRKAIILLCFAICLATGALFAFLQPPVFEASVKLRIGQVQGATGASQGASVALENADELVARLLSHFGENVADGIRRDLPFLTKAAVQKNSVSITELVAEGASPADATDLLRRVLADVQKAHGEMYERNTRFLNERLQNLDLQRTALQQQYEDASRLVEQLRQRDAIQASLIMLERSRISAAISALDAEKPELMQKLVPPQTRPTELLGEIVAPGKAARPKKALVLVLAAVLGMMAGVMLAFVVEFVAKARMHDNNEMTTIAPKA
jgi:uncharacterized protein involved in exopolysaccharide biosynthesis